MDLGVYLALAHLFHYPCNSFLQHIDAEHRLRALHLRALEARLLHLTLTNLSGVP